MAIKNVEIKDGMIAGEKIEYIGRELSEIRASIDGECFRSNGEVYFMNGALDEDILYLSKHAGLIEEFGHKSDLRVSQIGFSDDFLSLGDIVYKLNEEKWPE